MTTAQKDDRVRVYYTVRLSDGSVYDTTGDKDPFEFVVGDPELIPGMHSLVTGMRVGEKRSKTLKPEEAYGKPSPYLVTEIPRKNLPDNIMFRPGVILDITGSGGETARAKVVEVTDENVTIDANHELAGMEVILEIILLEIKKPDQAGE
ncbi:MAG: peptidylprolyl isomerase [Candidatus Dadabacteria bacterium]|nr:MAG: peptidylprolyl isomerase [Candidatus Dadabacteria bacterium]